MSPKAATAFLPTSLRPVLVLGRISNLPTVWSDCLAAWSLGGGKNWRDLALVALGASFIYTAGMFLNDAFDVEFDRRYRAERPIISGEVRVSFVWCAGIFLLLLGWVLVAVLGGPTPWLGFLLVATVLVYNALHKKTLFGPLLMAACRFLLYLVAASTASTGLTQEVVWRSLALAGYIIGLSYIARRESSSNPPVRWSIPFLFSPIAVALGLGSWAPPAVWAPIVVLTAWILWCVSGSRGVSLFRRGVPGLLAGIALVDWLALHPTQIGLAAVFVCLFLLSLVLQKVAPAS